MPTGEGQNGGRSERSPDCALFGKAAPTLTPMASRQTPPGEPAIEPRPKEARSSQPPPVIEVRGLTKTYRTYKKRPGLWGAVRGLFHREYEQLIAANDVSFAVREGELVG